MGVAKDGNAGVSEIERNVEANSFDGANFAGIDGGVDGGGETIGVAAIESARDGGIWVEGGKNVDVYGWREFEGALGVQAFAAGEGKAGGVRDGGGGGGGGGG